MKTPVMSSHLTADEAVDAQSVEQVEVSGKTSPVPDAQLKDAVYSLDILPAKGFVPLESTVSKIGYVSLSDVTAQEDPVPSTFPKTPETEIDELSKRFSEEVGLSTPESSNLSPTQTPVVRLHFMRHAQAEHNVKNILQGYSVKNPSLTDIGHEQCEVVSRTFPHMDKITHILCSPLTRTVQTAVESFKPLFDRGLKIILWPQLIEFGQGPTNRGDPISELKKKVEGIPVDFDYLTDGWEKAANMYLDRHERVRKVACTLHTFSRVSSISREDPRVVQDVHILVISHGSFLRHLIRERPRFMNCQVRTCEFATKEQTTKGASSYDLFETTESKKSIYQVDWEGQDQPVDSLDLAGEDGA